MAEGAPHDAPTPPSERSFGVLVGGVLAAIGAARLVVRALDSWPPRIDALSAVFVVVGGALIVLAVARPAWLRIPNRLWFKFGLLLSRIVNPVILFLIYAVCVVPIGVVMRFFGHDPLRLKRDSETPSHWREHEGSPLEEPMRHQF